MKKYKVIWYVVGWVCVTPLSLWPLKLINVAEYSIYFAPYYKDGNKAVKYTAPESGYYTTLPNGIDFLAGKTYKEIPSFYLSMPSPMCAGWFSGACVSRYPNTVFFSFAQEDIKKQKLAFKDPLGEPTNYLGKDIGSALYQGWSMQDDRTYFIFYNPFGFDPIYASHGKRGNDIAGGKLNACGVDTYIENSLRRYLVFARYFLFE